MSHLLLCRLHLCSRVATLPAIKDVEAETTPRNRAPIGRRNSLRAMQPLLRHDSHSPMPRQLRRSGRPGTITGQHRASPSPGRQHRNGRKHRLRTATQALDMPQFQCRNPSRLRRTRRARASQRTTNTRQLLIIWLLQQAPIISSVEGAPTSISQDTSPVSVRLCHRGGLPEVPGGLWLARWVHLPSMRARKILRIGEPTAAPMRQVSAPDFPDIWDHSSPDEDSADPLVLGGVSDDH